MSDQMKSFIVGRGQQADIALQEDSVSREHLRLEIIDETTCIVEDLGSSNGSYVLRDGKRYPIERAKVLYSDALMLGEYQTTVASLLHGARPVEPSAVRQSNNNSPGRDPISRYIRTDDGRYIKKS